MGGKTLHFKPEHWLCIKSPTPTIAYRTISNGLPTRNVASKNIKTDCRLVFRFIVVGEWITPQNVCNHRVLNDNLYVKKTSTKFKTLSTSHPILCAPLSSKLFNHRENCQFSKEVQYSSCQNSVVITVLSLFWEKQLQSFIFKTLNFGQFYVFPVPKKGWYHGN